MARSFLTAINLNKNELQNATVQNLAAAPSSPVKGQIYYDSTGNVLYWWNGTAWVAAQGGASVSYGSVPAETTFGLAKNDGVATTVARSDHTHGSPTHDSAAHNGIPISALGFATADVLMNGFKITNVGAPVNPGDAANKGYVDNAAAGLSWKDAVRIATTANVAQSGLTAIDGVTPSANDRVLCKDQTTGSQNGIWLAQSGAWTRATDFDAAGEADGAVVLVMEGTLNADTSWVCTTNAPITIGTTALTWVQFGSGTIANDAVTNAKLANMPMLTIKGNDTASTADPKDLTAAQMATAFGFLRKQVTFCAAAVSTVVSHPYASQDVAATVYRATTPFDEVDCDIEHTDANTVTVRFTTAPTAGQYTIVVMG